MPDVATAAEAIVDRLTAAGVRACLDLPDLHPPGAILRAPPVADRFKGGTWDASWTLHAVAPDSGFASAMRTLGTFLDDVQAALAGTGVEARPVIFQTAEGADLPAYELTWTDRIT